MIDFEVNPPERLLNPYRTAWIKGAAARKAGEPRNSPYRASGSARFSSAWNEGWEAMDQHLSAGQPALPQCPLCRGTPDTAHVRGIIWHCNTCDRSFHGRERLPNDPVWIAAEAVDDVRNRKPVPIVGSENSEKLTEVQTQIKPPSIEPVGKMVARGVRADVEDVSFELVSTADVDALWRGIKITRWTKLRQSLSGLEVNQTYVIRAPLQGDAARMESAIRGYCRLKKQRVSCRRVMVEGHEALAVRIEQ